MPSPDARKPQDRPSDPLHGVTLEQIVTALEANLGWERLGQAINIRCFTSDPSVKSSLKYLRRTPWARKKVEDYYLYAQRKGWLGERQRPSGPRQSQT